jgi:hypothetical protein
VQLRSSLVKVLEVPQLNQDVPELVLAQENCGREVLLLLRIYDLVQIPELILGENAHIFKRLYEVGFYELVHLQVVLAHHGFFTLLRLAPSLLLSRLSLRERGHGGHGLLRVLI